MSFVHLFVVTFSLGVGNFLWQAMSAQDWATATERTLFQFVACVAVMGTLKLTK